MKNIAERIINKIIWGDESMSQPKFTPMIEYCISCKQPKNSLPTNQCKYGNKYHTKQ